MFPDPTVFPSLIHVIFGVGFPMAVQWNVTVAPSMMVWSAGVFFKLGGTAKKEKKNRLSFFVWVCIMCFCKLVPQADHPMCSWLIIVDIRRTKEIY